MLLLLIFSLSRRKDEIERRLIFSKATRTSSPATLQQESVSVKKDLSLCPAGTFLVSDFFKVNFAIFVTNVLHCVGPMKKPLASVPQMCEVV